MRHIQPKTSKGSADWFTGDVYPTIVLMGEALSHVRMASVHFTPGSRTAWHSHSAGQYLHVVEGTALVQERGGNVNVIKTGETIYTEPGVEHWHGASQDSFMTHIAVWEGDGTTWKEHVTDAEYQAAN